MSNDMDWVADVRRWYLSGLQAAPTGRVHDDTPEIGYEAAHPALQARHWPDAPLSAVTDPT